MELPKFAEVNGNLQSEFYDIQNGDDIKMLNYYTVSQIIEFMDVILNPDMNIYVNNKLADRDTKCYDNFSVIWTMEDLNLSDVSEEEEESAIKSANQKGKPQKKIENYEDAVEAESIENSEYADDGTLDEEYVEYKQQKEEARRLEEESRHTTLTVFVNGDPVTMSDKTDYVFVDIFDHIDFDLKNRPAGKGIDRNKCCKEGPTKWEDSLLHDEPSSVEDGFEWASHRLNSCKEGPKDLNGRVTDWNRLKEIRGENNEDLQHSKRQ